MTIWDFFSWIANCQLFLNDVNIIGALWAVAFSLLGYNRLKQFNLRLKNMKSNSWVMPFLLSVTLVVWIQHIIDLFVITPIAIFFGRWVEMPSLVQPLSVLSFLLVYWNVILSIIILSSFYWKQRFFYLLHFTKKSFLLLLGISIFYIAVTMIFGIWNYNLLVDPMRTIYFWLVYPELRVLWGFLFLSIIRSPDSFLVAHQNGK